MSSGKRFVAAQHGTRTWNHRRLPGNVRQSPCERVGLVNGGHTLFGRSAQALHELQGEEVEGVRQEVREAKDEENGEINVEGEPHTS